MEKRNQTRVVAISLKRDEDGRDAARIVALSMGILFTLLFALQAFSS
jgi:hypothetical protein